MTSVATSVRARLLNAGYSSEAVKAAWPTWWSDEAEASESARAELRFAVSRNLGLDPRWFFREEEEPLFVWTEEARFKHLTAEDQRTKGALTSFGMSVAGLLAASASPPKSLVGVGAIELRTSILSRQSFVRLVDLLGICWALGYPVIHLRVFPLEAKRMAAMTVRLGERFVILLAKDATYPAWIAFYLAHELGHIALGHVGDGTAVVDLERSEKGGEDSDDVEERAADAFALELLTGSQEPLIQPDQSRFTARQLAGAARKAAARYAIEPGTLALCTAHVTGQWKQAGKALSLIYTEAKPAWIEVNRIARRELDLAKLSQGQGAFLEAVMGGGLELGSCS